MAAFSSRSRCNTRVRVRETKAAIRIKAKLRQRIWVRERFMPVKITEAGTSETRVQPALGMGAE
jgi:hypothetical protein